METAIGTLLKSPGRYFEAFEEKSPRWLIAYCGYYLVAFVEAVGNLVYRSAYASVAAILLQSVFGSILGAVFNILLYGILWMYVGSKIFGGRASFKNTVQAVGYAFLYPGLFSLITASLILLSAGLGRDATSGIGLLCLVLPVQLALGLWALACAGIAVKQLNGFNWVKTLGVLAWLPILLIVVLVVLSSVTIVLPLLR